MSDKMKILLTVVLVAVVATLAILLVHPAERASATPSDLTVSAADRSGE